MGYRGGFPRTKLAKLARVLCKDTCCDRGHREAEREERCLPFPTCFLFPPPSPSPLQQSTGTIRTGSENSDEGSKIQEDFMKQVIEQSFQGKVGCG